VRKRSVVIAGHRTSISLEEEFWTALRQVAERRGLSVNALVREIDAARAGNLSSALRLFVLDCYRRGELRAEFSGQDP
jgi:predicted DNA-binding ribbon-helix-helix protein